METRSNSETKKGLSTKQTIALIKYKPRPFRTQFNPTYHGLYDASVSGVSKTVPDQNLSVKQLLVNHTRGLPVPTALREPQYLGIEIPAIYDLNDLEENRLKLENVRKDINDELNMLQDIEDEKQEKAKQEAEQAAAKAATESKKDDKEK